MLNCADIATGDRLWRLRLKGPYGSSPVAAGSYLYFFDEKGGPEVVDISRTRRGRRKIVGEMDLRRNDQCTPAIGDGALFVRSNERLWKITGNGGRLAKP
ncbi:MAG: PQQ-binding-like beta-propeller repeat protein [Verrucomicrobiales bacterium]